MRGGGLRFPLVLGHGFTRRPELRLEATAHRSFFPERLICSGAPGIEVLEFVVDGWDCHTVLTNERPVRVGTRFEVKLKIPQRLWLPRFFPGWRPTWRHRPQLYSVSLLCTALEAEPWKA